MCCVVLAVVVALMFAASFFTPTFSFTNVKPAFNQELGVFQSILIILAVAPWAYVGFDNIPQTAEEFSFSPKKSFKLIVFSLLAGAATYIAMVLVTGWVFKDEFKLDGQLFVTGSVIEAAFGWIGVTVLATAILMGIFTGLNGFLMSSSRLLFSMGRSGVMPHAFKELHYKYNTPYKAIIFIVGLALISPWLGRTALIWIVDMSSTGVSIAYLVTCLSAFKLFSYRKRHQYYHPFYKTSALIGAVISLIFLILLLFPGSPASLSIESYIALFAWLILGIIFFFVRYKKLKNMKTSELDHLILNQKE